MALVWSCAQGRSAKNYTMRTILIVLGILVAWKTVRTDWIVICPWESYDDSPGSQWGLHDATYRPPVSPAWSPPDPVTSGILDFGSGNSFPRGTPWVRPYWELIGLKVGCPLMLICSVPILRFLIGKKGVVTNLAQEFIAESKKQNKPAHTTADSAPL